jgi:exopolysaccharide biosynthesis polyprenyl glycosylphosphotransferase
MLFFARKPWIAGLVALDVVAFAAMPAAALILRFRGIVPFEHAAPYLWFLPVLVIWRFFCAALCDLYNFRRRLSLSDFTFNAAGAALLAVAGGYLFLAIVQLYYLPETKLSRVSAALDAVGLFIWFTLSRWVVLRLLRLSGYRVRLMLLGATDERAALADEVRSHAPKLVEIIESDQSSAYIEQFVGASASGTIDQIILADAELNQHDLCALLRAAGNTRADVYLLPGVSTSIIATARVYSIAGLPLVPLQPPFLSSVYRPVKRAMDIVTAAVLLLLLAPMAAIVAMVIRAESAGPVLFSQARTGLSAKRFRVYKFRTMVANAEAHTGPVLSPTGDTRVTQFGRILRKYRIDEWPQLWNVLRGDMSLVGPRPERPEFAERFVAENPLYERRYLVRPGLTGMAQIHGRYDSDYAHKLRYDLIYINSISPITDLQILLATIRTVLTGHGAQ